MKNGQSRETGNIGSSRHKRKTNKQKTQQNMSRTPPYTRCKTKTNIKKTQKKTTQHNTRCVGNHYAQANTNNVNKTWALLQTTGGKDEPNIVSMQKSYKGDHNTERRT